MFNNDQQHSSQYVAYSDFDPMSQHIGRNGVERSSNVPGQWATFGDYDQRGFYSRQDNAPFSSNPQQCRGVTPWYAYDGQSQAAQDTDGLFGYCMNQQQLEAHSQEYNHKRKTENAPKLEVIPLESYAPKLSRPSRSLNVAATWKNDASKRQRAITTHCRQSSEAVEHWELHESQARAMSVANVSGSYRTYEDGPSSNRPKRRRYFHPSGGTEVIDLTTKDLPKNPLKKPKEEREASVATNCETGVNFGQMMEVLRTISNENKELKELVLQEKKERVKERDVLKKVSDELKELILLRENDTKLMSDVSQLLEYFKETKSVWGDKHLMEDLRYFLKSINVRFPEQEEAGQKPDLKEKINNLLVTGNNSPPKDEPMKVSSTDGQVCKFNTRCQEDILDTKLLATLQDHSIFKNLQTLQSFPARENLQSVQNPSTVQNVPVVQSPPSGSQIFLTRQNHQITVNLPSENQDLPGIRSLPNVQNPPTLHNDLSFHNLSTPTVRCIKSLVASGVSPLSQLSPASSTPDISMYELLRADTPLLIRNSEPEADNQDKLENETNLDNQHKSDCQPCTVKTQKSVNGVKKVETVASLIAERQTDQSSVSLDDDSCGTCDTMKSDETDSRSSDRSGDDLSFGEQTDDQIDY